MNWKRTGRVGLIDRSNLSSDLTLLEEEVRSEESVEKRKGESEKSEDEEDERGRVGESRRSEESSRMFSIDFRQRVLGELPNGEFRDRLLVLIFGSAEGEGGESKILDGESRHHTVRFGDFVDDFDGFLVSSDRYQEFRTANIERQLSLESEAGDY